ncbi:MAG: dehydrogenase, partial [Cytophagales bacterium]|nr:dehydrogenase [Cytophagales bacterium]
MEFDRKNYSASKLLELYKALLLPRLVEDKMLVLIRQGKLSKWFSGIGQEAVSVGAALALESNEWILPLHRNLGVFTAREVPLDRLFAQFLGKPSGFTKGRDRSFHFGSKEHHICGMISHLGPQMGVADGIALGNKIDQNPQVTLVFCGDGGTSEGDFHEALNLAAVWKLPVIFLIENNGYGLSTPIEEQYAISDFLVKGPAYNIETAKIDGNNILEVHSTISEWAEKIRKDPRPVLLEAMTFRMRGHEEASGTKYVPEELFEKWAKKDPIVNFENFLFAENILSERLCADITDSLSALIDSAWEKAWSSPDANDFSSELNDVYAPGKAYNSVPSSTGAPHLRYIDAISDGLKLAMGKFPDLILMGQDIAEYGGVFKVTEGLVDTFGKDRVRNTPLCESAVLGASLGLSIQGKKSIVEIQFADFVTSGFSQIVNNLAKSFYRWGQSAQVVIRMPSGAGTGAGPFHSQSTEAWFFHVPGLKIVYPSNPFDAKGLLLSAIEDPNPVLYFEHKSLYRSLSGPVPDTYYSLPLGKAALVTKG